MSNEQQRPEPRFKVGQVVMMVYGTSTPVRVRGIKWDATSLVDGWIYNGGGASWWMESSLRLLSAEEIGGDEVARLSEMLRGADSRRADMERERDATRGIARKLLDRLVEANESCRKILNGERDPYELNPQAWAALIAEAESVLGRAALAQEPTK